MGINGVLLFIRRAVIILLRFAFHHPFVFGMASFVILLNRLFPSFSGFLISSSPVIGCTLLFLWIILNCGPYDVNEREEHGKEKQDFFCYCPLNGRNNKVEFVEGRDVDKIGRSRKVFFHGVSGEELGKDVILLCSCASTMHKMRVVEEGKGDLDQISSEAGGVVYDFSEVYDLSEDDQGLQDVISMVDENHPVLDSEINQADSSSNNSDSQSLESENQENDELEEDRKNLKDAGISGMEMNQRLEHLITRRRSRKYLRSETDKSLVALDSNNPTAVIEELSRLLLLIPPRTSNLSDPREEASGLIPGSEPSIISTANHLLFSGNEVVNGDSCHQEFVASQPEEKGGGGSRKTQNDGIMSSSSRREIVKKHWISVRSRMSYAMRQLLAEEISGCSTSSSHTEKKHESGFCDSIVVEADYDCCPIRDQERIIKNV